MVEQETRARSAAAAERLGLPPSIQLPDGEYGQDAHLQLRVPYQVHTHLLLYFTSVPSRVQAYYFTTAKSTASGTKLYINFEIAQSHFGYLLRAPYQVLTNYFTIAHSFVRYLLSPLSGTSLLTNFTAVKNP